MGCGDVLEPLARMGFVDVTEPLQSICARVGVGVGASAVDMCQKFLFPVDVTEPLQSICARVGVGVGASAVDVCQRFLFPHLVSPHPVFDGQPKFGMEVAPRPVLADGLPYATLPGKGGLVFSCGTLRSPRCRGTDPGQSGKLSR